MKKLASTIGLLLICIITFAGGGESYTINKSISQVEWVGKKVTGSHEGTIQLIEGFVVLKGDIISSGEIIIDMNTIAVTDIENKGMNAKLKRHLTSPDFFGVEDYPTGKLKITSSEKTADNKLKLICELTLKGISKRIEIPTTLMQEENKLVAIGEIVIDRTLFDIKYGSGSFFDNLGDKAIMNDFKVKFKVAASK
ncbi:MAG: YceI family protein [Flavobacteriales bacterium]|nr:YceI family protein [Flavobacteriales bacterium]